MKDASGFPNAFKKPDDRDDRKRSVRERLGGGVGGSESRGKNRGDMIRLAAVGFILLLVVLGLVAVKFYEVKKTGSADKRSANLPRIEVQPDDSLRFDGQVDRFKDNGDAVDINSKEFLFLVDGLMRHFNADKIREQADKDYKDLLERWQKANGPSQYPQSQVLRMMWDYPEVSRGKFFRISGQLVEIYPEVVNTSTSSGIKDMWMCVMRDARTGRPVHFYTYAKPATRDGRPFPTKRVTDRDRTYELLDNIWCEIEGVFLKIRPFESLRELPRGGSQQREAAILIAGAFRELPAPPKPPDVGRYVAIGVALAAVVFGILVLVCVLIVRRHGKSDDMRIKLGLARMARARAAKEAAGESDWKSIEE
jgi:hypothetical protein